MQCAVAFGKFKFSEIAPTAQIIHLSSVRLDLVGIDLLVSYAMCAGLGRAGRGRGTRKTSRRSQYFANPLAWTALWRCRDSPRREARTRCWGWRCFFCQPLVVALSLRPIVVRRENGACSAISAAIERGGTVRGKHAAKASTAGVQGSPSGCKWVKFLTIFESFLVKWKTFASQRSRAILLDYKLPMFYYIHLVLFEMILIDSNLTFIFKSISILNLFLYNT